MREKDLMMKLGIWPNLVGYNYILYGLSLIKENARYLEYMTKQLYPDIAAKYNTRWPNIEKNIRTEITLVWKKGNKKFLYEIAGCELEKPPTVSQFFILISKYLNYIE